MKLNFTKYHANGNDFILILKQNIPENILNTNIIKQLCHRRTGIGADGLFVISHSKKYDFFLDYYNADGSWETLCANGSRCAVRFMYNRGSVNDHIVFGAGDGEHRAKILKRGLVSMSMNTPKYKSDLISVEGVHGFYIDTGAPHFVCETSTLDDNYTLEMGGKIRCSEIFYPRGINVNFYHKINDKHVEIKTYEKGVERLMLSCASGSTAVVFHLSQTNMIFSPITTISEGGNLIFSFDKKWKNAWVKGPAEFLFTGDFEAGVLV